MDTSDSHRGLVLRESPRSTGPGWHTRHRAQGAGGTPRWARSQCALAAAAAGELAVVAADVPAATAPAAVVAAQACGA